MSRAEQTREFLSQKKDRKKGLSSNQAAASDKAFRILQEGLLQTTETTFIDSQLMLVLTAENFEEEIAYLSENLQMAVRVICSELPDLEPSISAQSGDSVELQLRHPSDPELSIKVFVVSSDAQKDRVQKTLFPRSLSAKQLKEYLIKERIIVLVSVPRSSEEKVSKSFLAEYKNI